MALFEEAFKKTSSHEGGYVNDPDDAGGETYKGISRRFHPSWAGWSVVDNVVGTVSGLKSVNTALEENADLQEAVAGFYKSTYWDRFQGDVVPSQEIAEELFDTGVNMGVHRAVGFLQESLNLLNGNKKYYDDIEADGLFGPSTMKALEHALSRDDGSLVLTIMNVLQGMHYIEYMRKNPLQEKYARGWLKRVVIVKNQ